MWWHLAMAIFFGVLTVAIVVIGAFVVASQGLEWRTLLYAVIAVMGVWSTVRSAQLWRKARRAQVADHDSTA
jgi:hypothetical protein